MRLIIAFALYSLLTVSALIRVVLLLFIAAVWVAFWPLRVLRRRGILGNR